MPKDYAKRVFTTTRAHKKRRSRSFFVVIFSVVAAFAISFYCYYGHIKPMILSDGSLWSKAKNWLQTSSLKKPSENPVKTKEEEPQIHFEFYNQLPTMKLAASTPPATAKPKIPDPEAPLQYIVQLGIFKDSAAAGQLRLSLLLMGCEADVIKLNMKSGPLYRVQKGPFANKNDADKLQRVLNKKGVNGIIKKA